MGLYTYFFNFAAITFEICAKNKYDHAKDYHRLLKTRKKQNDYVAKLEKAKVFITYNLLLLSFDFVYIVFYTIDMYMLVYFSYN